MYPKRRSLPLGRVVYRGYYNAYANGGVSNANANNDASGAYTNVGSRLEIKQSAYSTEGRVPQSGAEGGKPQQQQPNGWKAEKSRIG